MQENGSQIENQNDDLTNTSSTDNEYSKWVDNQGDEVKNVFGFNSSAELVNGRAAMIGFLMLILTELVFSGRPVTSSIFGINWKMEEKKSNSIKVFLYISVWVIIWGTIGSFIDYPLYKNKIYLEGSIYQYLTFSITAIISIVGAKFFYKKFVL